MAREIKPYEELELKDDFMFGLIMHDPKYVKPFLEMILKIKIRKVVYPQSQKSIDLSANAKAIRLDVYVEDDQNTVRTRSLTWRCRRQIIGIYQNGCGIIKA